MGKFIQRQHKRLHEIAAKTPHIMPFLGDNPDIKAARIKKARQQDWEGFKFFCETYFPHIFTKPFCTIHCRMFTEIQRLHGIIGVTGFRGLGKTVYIAIAYSLWRIASGSQYVIHTAADVEQAQERTLFIHHELTNNKRLLCDFPEMAPVDVDTSDFFLKNKTRIRARGIKQTHRGTINPKTAKRPDLIVCDDIDKEENQGNQTIGKRRMNKICQELAGAMDPSGEGKVIWLGNLVHPNYAICQYLEAIKAEIKADNPEVDLDTPQVLKTSQRAILRYSLEDNKGRSVWEEQYPTKKLPELRKRYGNAGYQREMLGKPVIEGTIFKHEWFTTWRDLPAASKMKRVWLYADPAWGEKGCYKAVIAIAYDGISFYVVKAWVRQTENTKFFRYYYDAYQELDRTYLAKFRAACETTYGQQRILADFDRWASDNHLPPISHRIKKIDNKENKSLRIERTETIIETGKVIFPDGQDMGTLESQFLTYPDGYVDGPDALAGCLERFSEYDIGKNRVRVRRLTW